ncbi:MAG TPA: endolytic transglycosylase MltG [Bryobacteraceae bacterium]|nr:endolytic transglycosylase MltG [Bryobacteraceae bacterium]
MKKLIGVLVVLLILAALLVVRLSLPYRGFSGEIFVEIPRGTSTKGIAALLANAGVVRSRWDFMAARALRGSKVLQAGEYRFNRPASSGEVYNRIARGDTFYFELVVPEGKNMFDIGQAVEQLGLFTASQFLTAARNPAIIHDLDPHAPTLEGYLFPSTYRLGRHTTPEHLCQLMTARFREVWRGLSTSADVHETVTMASLVEKEGKLADERPRIAAVFENRLKIGMKLDCDPTTIYAALLADRYRGTIHRSDLDSDDPYNTYRHAGLPPGPIANPGVQSIHAVLAPMRSDELYFVARADGSGGHQFSSNLADHQAATERYRHGQRR